MVEEEAEGSFKVHQPDRPLIPLWVELHRQLGVVEANLISRKNLLFSFEADPDLDLAPSGQP